jgi:DNA-binding transcriptional MerR regulator
MAAFAEPILGLGHGVWRDLHGVRYLTEEEAARRCDVSRSTLRLRFADAALALAETVERIDRGEHTRPRFLIREVDAASLTTVIRRPRPVLLESDEMVVMLVDELTNERDSLRREIARLEERLSRTHDVIRSQGRAAREQQEAIDQMNEALARELLR